MFRHRGFWERVVQAGVTVTQTERNEKTPTCSETSQCLSPIQKSGPRTTIVAISCTIVTATVSSWAERGRRCHHVNSQGHKGKPAGSCKPTTYCNIHFQQYTLLYTYFVMFCHSLSDFRSVTSVPIILDSETQSLRTLTGPHELPSKFFASL